MLSIPCKFKIPTVARLNPLIKDFYEILNIKTFDVEHKGLTYSVLANTRISKPKNTIVNKVPFHRRRITKDNAQIYELYGINLADVAVYGNDDYYDVPNFAVGSLKSVEISEIYIPLWYGSIYMTPGKYQIYDLLGVNLDEVISHFLAGSRWKTTIKAREVEIPMIIRAAEMNDAKRIFLTLAGYELVSSGPKGDSDRESEVYFVLPLRE